MADTNQQELITQFSSVTGVDPDRAKFYLESAAWDLQLAMGSFYEEEDGMGDPVETESTTQPAKGSSSSRFTTFSSMSTGEEDSEEGQAFYAGGSETSGQQILGPPRKKSDNVVEHLMKSAKEHGAEVAESSSGTSQKVKKQQVFRGTGYKLGETRDTSETVQGEAFDSGPRQVDVILKLWKNGFSVDSGPLRDFNDPNNKEFLESISNGEVPRELIRMARGGEVNLNMEDHREEEYMKPKENLKAFSGEGHMLGSPTPKVLSTTSSQPPSSAPASGPAVSVDTTKPITSLQIRLADGTRVVTKFNHSHTVGDIRSHILAERPQYAGTSYVLMTTFPNKELTEDKVTLEEAKLLNAVIVQRMK